MFEIPHKPGSLADAMLVFMPPAESGVDRIVCCQTRRTSICSSSNWKGTRRTRGSSERLEALRRKTARLDVLGSYARAMPPA